MDETDPRHLLAQVAGILEKLIIPYAVTGGMAVFVWGRPRFTADIDIIVLLKPERVDELANALVRLSEASYLSREAIQDALERHGEFNFIDGASGIKVDFWVLDKTGFAESQLQRRVQREVLGQNVCFVSPEDLILSKLRWYKESGSSRQLEDVESVLAIQKKINTRYIKKWAKTHSTSKILENLLRGHLKIAAE